MAYLAAALPYITVAATAASTGVAVYETTQAGEQAQQAANFKAAQLKRQALEAQQSAGIRIAAENQKSLSILSSIRANAAASGVNPDVGSALETYTTSSEQAHLNNMYTRYAGNIEAQGDLSQAALTTYGGQVEKDTAFYTAAGDAIAGAGTIGKFVVEHPKQFHIE